MQKLDMALCDVPYATWFKCGDLTHVIEMVWNLTQMT